MDSRRGTLTGLHVVVVEDNEDSREIMRAVLGYFGASVTAASGAREGLKVLHELAPDVVVADIRLGDETAMWLLREARIRACRAPFIAVSGLDFDESTLAENGFELFLRKPVDHVSLVDAILAVARGR
jgi:ATP-binding cassette, subfamily B, bacterial